VSEAELEIKGESQLLAAKFYDPDTENPGEANEDPDGGILRNYEKSYMFVNEITAYQRLAGSSVCPRFYGAFQGIGFTGYVTGLVLVELLPETFKDFADMRQTERTIAYEHVLELHTRHIRHGDVEARNFGRTFRPSAIAPSPHSENNSTKDSRREAESDVESLLIFDFSHSSFFQQCDPDQCSELRTAKASLIGSSSESQGALRI
jgi:hypothetical protein